MQIYTITYSDNQPSEYNTYFNSINTVEEKSYLFEYNVILKILEQYTLDDYTGVFSWKFPYKTQMFKKKLEWLFKNNPNYDVYNFCTQTFKEGYLQFTEKCHPGFLSLFSKLCKDLDLPTYEPKHTVYSNFFICKTEIYKKYANEIIIPAINLLETKYKEEAWKNANYITGLKTEELQKLTGLEYYTFHTFILERLFSQFLEKERYKVFNIKNYK